MKPQRLCVKRYLSLVLLLGVTLPQKLKPVPFFC